MENYQTKLKPWKNKPFINQLIKAFPAAEVFLVGGAVRDAMLSRQTKDYDLVIRNVSKNDLGKFLANHGKVNLVGKRFGVFKFSPKNWTGGEIDIALPRTEHSIGMSGAYKDFKISSNAKLKIEDDLSRRDFTINAMAFNVVTTELIDPFKGEADLNKKTIQTVGRAEKRFKEDYSRMLRAIRFSCQLNFKIDPKSSAAIKKEIKKINKKVDGNFVVPREVIATELNKTIIANPVKALELLDKFGAVKELVPELLTMKNCPQPKNWHSEGDVWIHTLLALKILESKKFAERFKNPIVSPELKWGLIFHDLGKPYTITKTDKIRFHGHDRMSEKKFSEIAKRLKLSAAGLDVERVEKLIAKHMFLANPKINEIKNTTLEKYFFNSDFPGDELIMLMYCDVSASLPPNRKPVSTNYNQLKARLKRLPVRLVTGQNIIKEFKLSSGPKIGKLLGVAREAQLKGKVKTKQAALKYLKKYL